MKCAGPDSVSLSHSLISHFVSLKPDCFLCTHCWMYFGQWNYIEILKKVNTSEVSVAFRALQCMYSGSGKPEGGPGRLIEAPCSISFKVTSNTYLHRQIRKRKPLSFS